MLDASGNTALHYASLNGLESVVNDLLGAKANTYIFNKKGETALNIAKSQNNEVIIKTLETNSQKSNIVDENEIVKFLATQKELKSASGQEVGEQDAGPSFTGPHRKSEVSQKREISETPNDSEYDADNSRSPSPSPRQSKKIRLGSPQIENSFG
jgi:ankyrin repeat protein